MMERYLDLVADDCSIEHQRRRGSADAYRQAREAAPPATLGPAEAEFLRERDSFYLSSVSANGWPYVQHRGGPVGFVHVLDETHVAWVERLGNRQFLTAGHVDGDDRVAVIAVDYPNRSRLKLLGHARFDPAPDAEMVRRLGVTGHAEGVMTLEVVAFDWNCPKYITPRFTMEQVEAAVEPLRRRIAELEAQVAAHG